MIDQGSCFFGGLRRGLGYAIAQDAAKTGSPSDGIETYLTQVVVGVLQQDAAPVRAILKDWLGLDIPASAEIVVQAERSYGVPGEPGANATIDMVVESGGHLCFFEHKTGADLNLYTLPDGSTENQLQRYSRVLADQAGVESSKRHLVAVTRKPIPDQGVLAHYEGFHFWWDLYRIIASHTEHHHHGGNTPGCCLQQQLLRYLESLQLDPPRPLTPEACHLDNLKRLLSDATLHVDGLENVKISSTGQLYFDFEGRNFSLWITKEGEFHGHETNIGGLVVRTPDGFWSLGADEQARAISAILISLSSAERVPSAKMPESMAIKQFDDSVRDLVEQIVNRATERWGKPITGTMDCAYAEISFRLGPGLSLRLGPYKPNRLILGVGAERVTATRDELNRWIRGVLDPRAEQVNIDLSQLDKDRHIEPILDLMDAACGSERNRRG